MLTRIESRQYVDREKVDINELIAKLVSDFTDFAELNHLTVSVVKKHALEFSMNPDLAIILFSNLIKNSLIHNKVGGEVRIEIADGSVRVSNTSEMGKMEDNKIFARFEKGGAEKSGTGLGLAIAISIADLYGFQISYHYDGMQHFRIGEK